MSLISHKGISEGKCNIDALTSNAENESALDSSTGVASLLAQLVSTATKVTFKVNNNAAANQERMTN